MFPSSTQYHHWMFKNEAEVAARRAKTNAAFIERNKHKVAETNRAAHFLSQSEEAEVVGYFSRKLAEFCVKFKPPMPRAVKGTAFHYFQRFYLVNSVMDYHPKEILVTAVYLATKVEEFNVSITQFVSNIQGNQDRASSIILNNELLLMQELRFHLTVHNPYRPVRGLLIDIKTRCDSVHNVDYFRPEIEAFLDQVFLTDAPLIFAPSQIALAAIIHAASRQKQNLDSYVTGQLFGSQGEGAIQAIIDSVRKIRVMVKNIVEPTRNIKGLMERLEACRNQDNNPDSSAYKRKLALLVDEEDIKEDMRSAKYSKLDEGDFKRTAELLGAKALSPAAP